MEGPQCRDGRVAGGEGAVGGVVEDAPHAGRVAGHHWSLSRRAMSLVACPGPFGEVESDRPMRVSLMWLGWGATPSVPGTTGM